MIYLMLLPIIINVTILIILIKTRKEELNKITEYQVGTMTNPPTITMTFTNPITTPIKHAEKQKRRRTHHVDYNELCEKIILDKKINNTPNNKIFKKFGTSPKAWKKHSTQEQKDRFYSTDVVETVTTNPFESKIIEALKYKEEHLCPDDKMYKKFDISRLMFSRYSTQEQKDKLLELQNLTRDRAKQNTKKLFNQYGANRKGV